MPGEDEKQPRNAQSWAKEVESLQLSRVPTGALNLNVEGRSVVGPLQGFGRLWQKTFRLSLPGLKLTPAEVMQIWKTNFPRFQPTQNHFYPVATLDPGQIMLINASLTGMPVSTGMMVLYADDESLTLMTPQGHPESGWITFSASEEENTITCQVQTIARANDPLYELGFRLFASSAQDRIWKHTLQALATHLQATEQASDTPATQDDASKPRFQVQCSKICLDQRVQWSEAKNIWQNAAIRTVLYRLATPFRWHTRRRTTPAQIQPEKFSDSQE